MNIEEKVILEDICEDGVFFEIDKDPYKEAFHFKLMESDIVIMCEEHAKLIFSKRSEMQEFARERGFRTIHDQRQCAFFFEREVPWRE